MARWRSKGENNRQLIAKKSRLINQDSIAKLMEMVMYLIRGCWKSPASTYQ